MSSHAKTKISVRDVVVEFPGRSGDKPVAALENVGIEIADGEFVCLLGPSGCGKTTLLNTIAGFIAPSHGEVLLDQQVIESPGPERGMIFQQYGLFPWFTVEQNIQYGPKLKGKSKSELKRISNHYVELIHLEGFEKSFPSELSGGMQQRVGIARALANQPEVLLLDEPFGALDALTREHMQEELLRIWEAEKRTFIFVTHSIDEAIFLADRVIVMSARPGRTKRDVAVDLPRPRDRTSDAFFKYYKELSGVLKDEIRHASAEATNDG